MGKSFRKSPGKNRGKSAYDKHEHLETQQDSLSEKRKLELSLKIKKILQNKLAYFKGNLGKKNTARVISKTAKKILHEARKQRY